MLSLIGPQEKLKMKGSSGTEGVWKPDIVVAVENAGELQGDYGFLLSMLSPKGSLQALSIQPEGSKHHTGRLEKIIKYYRDEGLYSTFSCIDSSSIESGAKMEYQYYKVVSLIQISYL